MVCLALIPCCVLLTCVPGLVTAQDNKVHFSQLLEATGVYHEGDKGPKPTTYRPTYKVDSEIADELEVGLISKELAKALDANSATKIVSSAKDSEIIPVDEPTAPAADTRLSSGQSGDSSGFMPRSFPGDHRMPLIPHPLPTTLGFPAIESFFNNFENNVDWGSGRTKRDTDSETESLLTDGELEPSAIDKRDADPQPSRLDHISVLPPPHDLPPRPDLPLFPPLGSPPPHHHSPTPHPTSGHHVTISTPTHHVSHGVTDHGTHQAVHKEHHQVHGDHGHLMTHHSHASPRSHGLSHALHPTHLPPQVHHTPIHHTPIHHTPIHVEAKAHHGHHSPSLPHQVYDHPKSGYAKPAYGGSLEDIFGIMHGYQAPEPAYHAPEPAYHAPEPAYHAPEPAYHAPEPAYHAPEPAYHAPEPAYHAPEPAYHKPEPAYHPPVPAYHAPEPVYHAPEPAYHAPEPAYHAPEPAYHPPAPAYHEPEPVYHAPEGPYVPDYSSPSGDYVPPMAKMAGHPFSLEAVFGIGMPMYYMKKYPHMAHMMHHEHHLDHPIDNYVEPAKPAYKPVKVYDHPTSGYAKPAHGASLEEIFGVHTAYHSPPKPAYHAPKPEYHPPKPEYHPPKPEYHPPKPAYHPPKPEYHPPKPEYHPPKPAYHPPKPAYHPAKPEYHPTKPVYHPPGYGVPQPHAGSLESVFGLAPTSYVTPAPHYDVPTTYKPKMPDYINHHPHSKSLPPIHDPGYVLHYLPYDSYQPVHPESIAHPPPVPHHPHAAHMLVPGTHVLPAPDMLPHNPHNPHPEVKSLDPFRGARKKRSPQSDRGQDSEILLLPQGTENDDEDNFSTRTHIINNSKFPQIIIIPQKQGAAQQDQFHVNFNHDGGISNIVSGSSDNNDEVEIITPGPARVITQEPVRKNAALTQRENNFNLANDNPQQALQEAQKKQRILIARLIKSMKAAERLKKIETAMQKQTIMLQQMHNEREQERPHDAITESRLQELEEASVQQAEILQGINDAIHDVNIGNANNSARLRVLEMIASKQKSMLNDLLTTPLSPVIDPEINEERLRQLEKKRNDNRSRKAEKLEARRKNALLQIEAVAGMIEQTRQAQSQRSRLARVLESVNDEVLPGLAQDGRDEEDQIISPSTRTMAWWQRLNNGFKRRQELHRLQL